MGPANHAAVVLPEASLYGASGPVGSRSADVLIILSRDNKIMWKSTVLLRRVQVMILGIPFQSL